MLFGLIVRERSQLQWLLWGLAAGIFIVCAAAITTRLLPVVWPVGPNLANERLSYPITYWNTLGLLASLGIVFSSYGDPGARVPTQSASRLRAMSATQSPKSPSRSAGTGARHLPGRVLRRPPLGGAPGLALSVLAASAVIAVAPEDVRSDRRGEHDAAEEVLPPEEARPRKSIGMPMNIGASGRVRPASPKTRPDTGSLRPAVALARRASSRKRCPRGRGGRRRRLEARKRVSAPQSSSRTATSRCKARAARAEPRREE